MGLEDQEQWSVSPLPATYLFCYLRLSLVSCDWGCLLFGPLQCYRRDIGTFMAAFYPLNRGGLQPLKM